MANEPRGERPYLPGYDFADQPETGQLPWSWARERLERARNYWVATTWPDGRPHSMPVWGAWLDDRFFFSQNPRSRRARNIAADPRVVVTTEDAVEGVIVEGTVRLLEPGAELDRFAAVYDRKYDEDIRNLAGGGCYLVSPERAFAVLEHESSRTTRWRFAT